MIKSGSCREHINDSALHMQRAQCRLPLQPKQTEELLNKRRCLLDQKAALELGRAKESAKRGQQAR